MKTASTEKEPIHVNRPPYYDQTVLVEWNGIRHLANQDHSGKWRTLNRRKELDGNVEVIRVVR